MRLIDADALKPLFRHTIDYSDSYCNHVIDSAPTIEAVPVVRGEWKKDGEYPWLLNCSGCGYSTECGTNYCPNCGADMRGRT